MLQTAPTIEHAASHQRLADRAVGRAFLALVIQDAQACEELHMLAVGTVRPDIVCYRQPVQHAVVVIVRAVAGGDVDEAGARIHGDEISRMHRHVVVIEAVGLSMSAQGMGTDSTSEGSARDFALHFPLGHAGGLGRLLDQSGCYDEALAHRNAQLVGAAQAVHHAVRLALRIGDAAVRRQGPGRGGPDDDGHAGFQVQTRPRRHNRERHMHRVRGMLVVLHLCVSQSGPLRHAPQYRLSAAI